jgi:hypothetical protein
LWSCLEFLGHVYSQIFWIPMDPVS